MQRLFTLLFCCSLCFSLSLSAQDAKNVYENMFCPIYEFDEYIMIGEWENIDEQEAILGAIAYMTFYRGDSTIAYQMYKEVGTIEPGETVEVRIGYIDWTQVLDAADIAWSEMKLETLNDINPGNDGVIKACSIVPDDSGITMADIREAIEELIRDKGAEATADAFLATAPSFPGRQVRSYGEPEIAFETTERSWLGWIYWNANVKLPSATSLIVIDMETLEIEEVPANWWPVIDDQVGMWSDPERLFVLADLPVEEIESEYPEVEKPEPVDSDSVCAILIGGFDLVGGSSKKDVEHFAWSLTENPYGPRLAKEQVVKMVYPHPDSVLAAIVQTRGKCKKLHFYFSGMLSYNSSTVAGHFELFENQELDMNTLASYLLETQIKNLCITIEGNDAEGFYQVLSGRESSLFRNIDFIASTSVGQKSTTTRFQSEAEYFEASLFTTSMMNCGAEVEADLNFDGLVDRQETYAWVADVNPETKWGSSLKQQSRFKRFYSRVATIISTETTTPHEGVDISIAGKPESGKELTVSSSVEMTSYSDDLYSAGLGVVEVLKNRAWGVDVSGAADFVDVLLWTNPFLDGLISQVVTLGAVYYDESSDTWLAFPEQSFDEETGVVTINSVPDGKYTIRLAFIESIVDVDLDIQIVKAYPNPAQDFVRIQSPFSGHCRVLVVSSAGTIVEEFSQHCTNGEVLSIQTGSLPAGNYNIIISSGMQTLRSTIIKL